MNHALGMLEVLGFSVAIAAADRAVKQAAVKIEGIDCNNPAAGDKAAIPLVVQVKLSGEVAHVEAALSAAKQRALAFIPEEAVLTSLIPRVAPGMMPLLVNGKVKKKVRA